MARTHHHARRTAPQDPVVPGLGLLFFAAAPMILWIFQKAWPGLLAALLLMGLFALALRLIAQGQQVQARYDEAEVAYRPRLPRKLMGSAMIGLLVMMLSAAHVPALWAQLGLGLLGVVLAVAAFGFDPLRDKGTDNPEVALRQSAAVLIADAERSLTRAVAQIDRLGDADLTRRTDRMRQTVLRLLRALSRDPEALQKLRKPLTKFLQMTLFEVDRLTEGRPGQDPHFARKRYLAKLSALCRGFEMRARRPRGGCAGDAFALETELLLDRMQHESTA